MKLTEILPAHMEPELGRLLREYVVGNLDEFKEVLRANPVRNQKGAISICEAFWLYCLTRDVQPELVVENGTMYGFSLYFLRRAAPQAEVHSFDPGPCLPEVALDGVQYHTYDWLLSGGITGVPTGRRSNALVFFDDHQDQRQRLAEVRTNFPIGPHVLFHDNYMTLEHSHRPIRYCDLASAKMCYTFENLRNDPIFVDTALNAQTYRWLTWIHL